MIEGKPDIAPLAIADLRELRLLIHAQQCHWIAGVDGADDAVLVAGAAMNIGAERVGNEALLVGMALESQAKAEQREEEAAEFMHSGNQFI
ncbi:hypothetical protein EDWATA_00418 [Edwardsiella tarda ATCC 23685]|uniref:Uncharacterized protein n=1 Tax=Edwardsiella tarda ATCC 23685 TaxID=500638 RepID=D4F137_EDWTA|nr:hypothetical protein EDWATA_00418 [Edwardsiella tarda ATCC 23685]BEH73690.1 hypothetical protein GBS0709_28070 [Edwardsiella tarda]